MGLIEAWDGRANLPISTPPAVGFYPAYPHRHSGSVVVAGFANTLQDDLARVADKRPGLPIIAVNKAAEHIKAFAVYSFHFDREKLGLWAAEQKKRFGEGVAIFGPGKKDWLAHNQRNYPYVDYWAPGTANQGSSGWCAARLARMLGFDEIILCGIPIEGRRYADRSPARYWQAGDTNAVAQFRKAIAADTDNHKGVYSMSGWTRDLLGVPAWA
jgi:hypothetical protein